MEPTGTAAQRKYPRSVDIAAAVDQVTPVVGGRVLDGGGTIGVLAAGQSTPCPALAKLSERACPLRNRRATLAIGAASNPLTAGFATARAEADCGRPQGTVLPSLAQFADAVAGRYQMSTKSRKPLADLDPKRGIGTGPQDAIKFVRNVYNSFTRLASP
jgi:hypothetical protein